MRDQWDCLTALCPNSTADIFLYIEEALYLLTCVPKMGLISYLSGIALEYYQESAGSPVIWPDATGLDCAIPAGFGQTLMTLAEVRGSTGTSLVVLGPAMLLSLACANAQKGQSHSLRPKFMSCELHLTTHPSPWRPWSLCAPIFPAVKTTGHPRACC